MFKKLGEKDLVDYSVNCPLCGKLQTVKVHPVSLEAYRNGAKAQDAFPSLKATEREILISGICPTCWDEMFNSSGEEATLQV